MNTNMHRKAYNFLFVNIIYIIGSEKGAFLNMGLLNYDINKSSPLLSRDKIKRGSKEDPLNIS